MNLLKERIIHIHDLTDRIRIKTIISLFNDRRLLLAPRRFRLLLEKRRTQQTPPPPISVSQHSLESVRDMRVFTSSQDAAA